MTESAKPAESQSTALAGSIASLAGVAIRSFLESVLVTTVAGVALAGLAYYLLRDHTLAAVGAAALAIVESLIAGILIGGKRALVMTLVQGMRTLGLGRAAIRKLFARLLEVNSKAPMGERGGRLAQDIERLPLAQAEQSLKRIVNESLASPEGSGKLRWFRNRLKHRLLRVVERYTLARFRAANQSHGGVDLTMVQSELETRIDDHLSARLQFGWRVWLGLTIVALPAAIVAQTYVIFALLR